MKNKREWLLTFTSLCHSDFPLRAFFYLLEIEMKDFDSFVHKSNKALKCSQYISTILKCSVRSRLKLTIKMQCE